MQEKASTHPTSTSVQRLFNFSWKFMIEGDGESQKDRGRKRAKHSLALLYLGSAGQHNSLKRKATLSQSTYTLILQ